MRYARITAAARRLFGSYLNGLELRWGVGE